MRKYIRKYLFPRKVYFKINYTHPDYPISQKCPFGYSLSKDIFSGIITTHKNAYIASDACRDCVFYKGDTFTYGIGKHGNYILCNRKQDNINENLYP